MFDQDRSKEMKRCSHQKTCAFPDERIFVLASSSIFLWCPTHKQIIQFLNNTGIYELTSFVQECKEHGTIPSKCKSNYAGSMSEEILGCTISLSVFV